MVASLYGVEQEQKAIWVFLEQEGGSLESVSLELLCKGRELADQAGWQLAGLLLGRQVEGLVDQAFACGADEIWLGEHPLLEYFTIDAYASAAFQALLLGKPSVFLCGATPNGRDLAGRLAVRLHTGLSADCSGLRLGAERGALVSEVSGFGGGVLALIEMHSHRPQMATVRPGVFSTESVRGRAEREATHTPGKVNRFSVDLTADQVRTRIVERSVGEGANLGRAPVLVAGGRGMAGDFEELKELAELLGGEYGGTRPAVDEGYIERERQIGQTGVVCSPKLALCCGISGAFHFVVGIEKAGTVVAINLDPQAPIFEFADYCVVADAHQILPALRTALSRAQEVAHA